MELETTFYILGIVYMAVMLIITFALLIAILKIKKKIDAVHQKIDEKLAIFASIARLGNNLVGAAKRAAGK